VESEVSKRRALNQSEKNSIVQRLEAGEGIGVLSAETGICRSVLSRWRKKYRLGGVAALRGCGRPCKSKSDVSSEELSVFASLAPSLDLPKALDRIAALEQKIGQQAYALDFFRQALQRVRDAQRKSAAPGAERSTESSTL
jgi:transposase-like protein